jgi:hypothetical protein
MAKPFLPFTASARITGAFYAATCPGLFIPIASQGLKKPAFSPLDMPWHDPCYLSY